ncbi:sugar isomerase [Mangrovactinospora gilvigrisea]|uniref:Sugar isomerase n=1 Tax=Mangrovactinospora gilvigrisea TaxID=1428644 RepID=A0A1J7CBP4_9ACTN|nr:sugar isomerase [Mangrovactinospora gilvigrisea]OIV37074.1 sugar isomerase [Mangrovactinospora gilvigrisea]
MPSSSSSLTSQEIDSQPQCWRRAAETATAGPAGTGELAALPEPGERVAVIGCGTSWFIGQSYAVLRERAGQGETDAFTPTEFPAGRTYDRVVALCRSGTTTEVLELLNRLRAERSGSRPRVTAVTADPKTPIMDAVDDILVLDYADEQSVVQTRYATTQLALLRAHLGDADGVARAAASAEAALREELPAAALAAEQFTFLGAGWTIGLAQEAALKMREAAGAWTEAYPAMEYRHGPISITGPGRVSWALGAVPEGLREQVAETGGTLIADSEAGGLEPMADLVRIQRLAVALAEGKGYNPDSPRNLTRSVVLK